MCLLAQGSATARTLRSAFTATVTLVNREVGRVGLSYIAKGRIETTKGSLLRARSALNREHHLGPVCVWLARFEGTPARNKRSDEG